MDLSEKVLNGIVILSVSGNMGGEQDSVRFKTKIDNLVERGKNHIALDLAECPYVNAIGLGDIVRAYTTVSRKDGHLVLMHLSKRIHDLLAITKLLAVFEVYKTEEDAISALEEKFGK